MTYAPARLLDVRRFVQPIVGLPDESLGIAPDAAHVGGYHCGWDRRRIVDGVLSDYSWQESSRDWNHRTDAASAFDLGWFDVKLSGRRVTLLDFNRWLVDECAAGARDTSDIREVIYTPDGSTVRRWDRLGRRASGDSSHLSHTHVSYFRDAEAQDKTGPFRRFFGQHLKGDNTMLVKVTGQPEVWVSDGTTRRHLTSYQALVAAQAAGYQLVQVPTAADLEALAGPEKPPAIPVALSETDRAAIVADLVAGVTPLLPTPQEIADLLAARLAS